MTAVVHPGFDLLDHLGCESIRDSSLCRVAAVVVAPESPGADTQDMQVAYCILSTLHVTVRHWEVDNGDVYCLQDWFYAGPAVVLIIVALHHASDEWVDMWHFSPSSDLRLGQGSAH